MKDFSKFTIPVQTASEWTKKWKNKNPKNSKAFLLPIEDLLGCLVEMGIAKLDEHGNGTITYKENEKVRTYLGIDDNGEEKLLMVGTKNEGEIYTDIINEDSEKEVSNSGIFDFTDPCPTDCDPNSPLNP